MSTKVLRCQAPGCRTLTANGLCDAHRAGGKVPATVAGNSTAPARSRVDEIEAEIQVEFAESQAMRRDEMRDRLARLRQHGERLDRAGEKPRFEHG